MDFFENHLQINKLIISEFSKMLSNINSDIQFYKNYELYNSEQKITLLEKKKVEIENIILVFNKTGKLHM